MISLFYKNYLKSFKKMIYNWYIWKIQLIHLYKRSLVDKAILLYSLYRFTIFIRYIIRFGINDIKITIFKYLKNISYIKNKINNGKKKMYQQIKKELNQPIKEKNLTVYTQLPKDGINSSKIINLVNKYKDIGNFNWTQGRVSGTVYNNSESLKTLMHSIFPIFYQSNPLHPDVFPGIRKMEAEIINICGNFLYSENLGAGSFTSGGTESIILACKAYRDIAYNRNILHPEIIVCNSGHAAYWKAGNYLGIKIIEDTYCNDLNDSKKYGKLTLSNIMKHITSNTIAIITSAPSFNFGIIDPVSEISEYCYNNNIYLHVDMCLGGFILPFLEEYQDISFKSRGVTSISLDTHKYGCGPKGGSVILYRNHEIFKYQMFVKDDWSGGIYGTANISGSRNGNSVVLTWATLMHLGFKGYQIKAQNIRKKTLYLYQEINKITELFVYGKPEICIVAIGSHEFDIYLLCDQLKILGWNLNILQNPAAFHFCITNCHTIEILKLLIIDIKSSITKIKIMIQTSGNKQITSKSLYGSTQKINDSEIISDVVKEYFCIMNDI